MRKPFCLQAIAAVQASQFQFPVQWAIPIPSGLLMAGQQAAGAVGQAATVGRTDESTPMQ